MHNHALRLLIIVLYLAMVQCTYQSGLPAGAPDNGGLFLPGDFEALVVVDSLEGQARHIAVNDNGDIYVKLRQTTEGEGCAALRDTNNDGTADIIKHFAKYDTASRYSLQTGMRIHKGYLYFSSELAVYRYKLSANELVPSAEMETILIDDHEHGRHEHIAKPISFDDRGHMYIPFGAPSNACQEPKRTPGVPGLDPCPQLEDHGGIWRFDVEKPNQTQRDGYRFSTGIRSVVAMDWNQADRQLYVVIHGRDDLLRLFSGVYSPWQSAELPSEEFVRVTDGSDFGWPYCYYDQIKEQKVLAPEYGGDGTIIGRCSDYDLPLMGFPGHWAPNDLLFYYGNQFPKRYRGGAFIAFHGSTNRAPYPQAGYFICFVPFKNGQPTGEWEVFADGFAQVDPIVNVSDALYRPMGLAVGHDGSLYIGDTEKGKIWRVMYKGAGWNFGKNKLKSMEQRKLLAHIRRPDIVEDNLQKDKPAEGKLVYTVYCGTCHQMDGKGDSGRFPSLVGTDWVTGEKERLIRIVLNGMEGSIEVNGIFYNGLMPQHSFLSDEEIAEVLTYIRQSFGNDASGVSPEEVRLVRGSLELE